MFAAVLFLGAYAWPILDPSLDEGLRAACEVVQVVVWFAFALDYVVRLSLADDRWQFLRRNALDLLVIVLPLLRPLRLLRLLVVLRVLNRSATSGLHGRVATYVVGGSGLLAFLGALTILDVERGAPDATIETFGDALWWSAATMTTVGYGDQYPTTGLGRWVAVGLMVCGIALLGAVTASLAAWLTERIRADAEEEVDALEAEVEALEEDARDRDRNLAEQLQLLSDEVAALREAVTAKPGGAGHPRG